MVIENEDIMIDQNKKIYDNDIKLWKKRLFLFKNRPIRIFYVH